jgi:hypothetical protein
MTEFIEFIFPCTDCLVAAACKQRTKISKKELLDGNSYAIRCLALPMYDKETSSHIKSLLECIAHLAWKLASQLNEDRQSKVPSGYRHFLIEYLKIFGYITNSTSWHACRNVQPFDSFEVKERLKNLSNFLDWKE